MAGDTYVDPGPCMDPACDEVTRQYEPQTQGRGWEGRELVGGGGGRWGGLLCWVWHSGSWWLDHRSGKLPCLGMFGDSWSWTGTESYRTSCNYYYRTLTVQYTVTVPYTDCTIDG
nr:hypothetical protein CFP56_60732 [Quercus suber]